MADVLTPYYKRLRSHCYTVRVCSYKVGIGRRTGLVLLAFSKAITCPDAKSLFAREHIQRNHAGEFANKIPGTKVKDESYTLIILQTQR